MNEMRSLIGRRLEGEATPRTRAGTLPSAPTPRSGDAIPVDDTADTLQELVSEADRHITRACSNHEAMQHNIQLLADDFKQVNNTVDIESRTLIFY